MNRKPAQSTIHRAVGALICVAALAVAGCDAKIRASSPTSPHWEPGERSLEITGTLTTEEGALIEATLLFDGRELADARSTCDQSHGCRELALAGFVRAGAGQHTISFRVLDQTREIVEYLAACSVGLSGEGLGLGGIRLPLETKRALLEAGGEISFDLRLVD